LLIFFFLIYLFEVIGVAVVLTLCLSDGTQFYYIDLVAAAKEDNSWDCKRFKHSDTGGNVKS
jgi:hypothetical protein